MGVGQGEHPGGKKDEPSFSFTFFSSSFLLSSIRPYLPLGPSFFLSFFFPQLAMKDESTERRWTVSRESRMKRKGEFGWGGMEERDGNNVLHQQFLSPPH